MLDLQNPRGATHALSIKQPWLDAILFGTKRIENRTWKREHTPGWIWLHAPESYDKAGERWMRERGLHNPELGVPRGAILGLAYVHTITNAVPKHDQWAFGPVCWFIYEVIQLLDPVPCKGALGVWRVPDAELEQARAEVDVLDLTFLAELDGEWPNPRPISTGG